MNPGFIVKTKSGKTGRTYNREKPINGKIIVHIDDGQKILCDPKTLLRIGFID